jgi:putative DNA primase/helicase
MHATSNVLDFNTAAPIRAFPTSADNTRRLEALRAALKARAPEIVRDWLPRAIIKGGEARVGDVSGEPGESLSIALAGDRSGLWRDHHTGEGGDLIDLWALSQGVDVKGPAFGGVVADLEQYLGIGTGHAPPPFGSVHRVAAERAKAPAAPEVTKTLEATHVYTSSDGRTVLAQVLRYQRSDGKKTFQQRNAVGEWKSPEVRPLYNLPMIASAPFVVLVEGEKCADALVAEFGMAATTVMGGANTILDRCDLEPLRGKTVVTWADNDDAGRAFMLVAGARLRAMGCTVCPVTIPPGRPDKWDAADCLAEGLVEAAHGLIAGAMGPRLVVSAPVVDRSLKFLTLEQLAATKPPEWLIDGILPAASFAAVVAPHASYKSFLTLDFALCIANGHEWQGRAVKQGPVAYVAGEGQAGMVLRALGWTERKGGSMNAPFITVPQGVAMPSGQLDELLAGIRAMPAPPVLIVLDTLARCFGSGDENSSTDMGAFILACDRMRLETGACVLVVHHTGKDAEKGARGSSALPGAVDCLIVAKRTGNSMTVMNRAPIGKMKDAAEFDDIALAAVPIQFERDGVECSTLVLTVDESPIAGPGEWSGADRPSKNEAKVLAKLRQAADAGGPDLGFTDLQLATGINKGTLSPLLVRMVAKAQIEVEQNDGRRVWRCV